MHVHVSCPDGEAKFWLEPVVALVNHIGLSTRQLKVLQRIIEGRRDEIVARWHRHFSG